MANLRSVGYIVRQAKSGRIIVKLQVEVKEGTTLYDRGGRKIGLVREVFGPVSAPYASLEPRTDRVGGIIDNPIYIKKPSKRGD